MAKITLAEICDAIEETLATATGMSRTQSYDELGEAVNAGDCPLLQVYWEDYVMDPGGQTDRASFQGGVRVKQIRIHADVFASQRGNIRDDMKRVVDIVDTMTDVLEAQNTKPYFGLTGLKAFKVESATRAIFDYGGVEFMGARFVLAIWVF